jgi:hypothetical protein
MKQTRQPVHTIKQSIYLDVYDYTTPAYLGHFGWHNTNTKDGKSQGK